MAINTQMSGADLDAALKAFYEVMNESNDGKILHIKNGTLAASDAETLFNVVKVE